MGRQLIYAIFFNDSSFTINFTTSSLTLLEEMLLLAIQSFETSHPHLNKWLIENLADHGST